MRTLLLFLLTTGFAAAPAAAQTALPTPPALRVETAAFASDAPAPARRTLRVVVVMPSVGVAGFTLTDARGVAVRTPSSRLLWKGTNAVALDVAGLAVGSYRLRIETPQGIHVRPVRVR